MPIEAQLKKIDDTAAYLGDFQRKKDMTYIPAQATAECSECGSCVVAPLVLDAEIKEQVGTSTLCFNCTEQALGRQLTIADLVPCMNNHQVFFGYALAKRESN